MKARPSIRRWTTRDYGGANFIVISSPVVSVGMRWTANRFERFSR